MTWPDDGAQASSGSRPAASSSGAPDPGEGSRTRRARGPRRATGGTVGEVAGTPADGSSLLPGRSADDTDTGWNDRAGDVDDERLLREVPPHW